MQIREILTISPLYFVIFFLSQIQISLATCEINLMSCDTRTSPPLYSLTAFAKASIDSISKEEEEQEERWKVVICVSKQRYIIITAIQNLNDTFVIDLQNV